MSQPGSVSVVIRIRNEAASLRKVLEALQHQSATPYELIIVDNESSDESREVACRFGARIVDISRSEFSYGRASNRGIEAATGEFILLLSAHALPIGPDFLERAVEPFRDPRVAAVRCLHACNTPEIVRWMKPDQLSWPAPISKIISAGPVACACAIRRPVWESIRFDESLASVEDKFWAAAILKAGYLITSAPALYLYTREVGLIEDVRRMNRDRLEFFRQTGKQWQEPQVTLRRLLVNVLHNHPRRAIRSIFKDILLFFHLRSIPLQARRTRRTGSDR